MKPTAKQQFIDVALRLFAERGYDATSVQDLLAETKLSKGAFYHHFCSKDALLDAVVDRLTDEALARVNAAVDAAGPEPIARLAAFVGASRQWRLDSLAATARVTVVLFRDENVVLRHRLQVRGVDKALPLLAEILAEGVAQEKFSVSNVEETARLSLLWTHAIGEVQIPAAIRWRGTTAELESIKARADVSLESLERMLGAPRGCLPRVSLKEVKRFASAMRKAAT